jgi:hypothetical protein
MKRQLLSATQIHQREQARVGLGRGCRLRGPAHGKRCRHDKGLVIALGRLQAYRPKRLRLGWRWYHGDFDCLFFRIHDVDNMAIRRRHRNPENWNLGCADNGSGPVNTAIKFGGVNDVNAWLPVPA